MRKEKEKEISDLVLVREGTMGASRCTTRGGWTRLNWELKPVPQEGLLELEGGGKEKISAGRSSDGQGTEKRGGSGGDLSHKALPSLPVSLSSSGTARKGVDGDTCLRT